MSENTSPEPKKDSCLVRGIRFLVRLTLALIVGIAIGIGVYYGVSWMVGEYMRVTQEQQSRITALEMEQTQMEQSLSGQIADLQGRVDTLDVQGDTQKEAIASLESRLDTQDSLIATQQASIDDLLSSQKTLADLQTQIDDLRSDLEDAQRIFADLDDQVTALDAMTVTCSESLTAVDTFMTTGEAQLTTMQQQIVFLQAMELLTRARLNLVQGNTPLASSDIEAARDLLADLQTDLPGFQSAYVDDILAALDGALESLPVSPVTAADQLEAAWQLLFDGLPNEPVVNETPTESPTVTPSP